MGQLLVISPMLRTGGLGCDRPGCDGPDGPGCDGQPASRLWR